MTQTSLAGEVPQWTLADRLRKARLHAGLEQRKFAEDIGISPRSLTNYELGHSTPGRPVLLSWAMRTGVDMAWLVGNDGGGRARRDSNPRPSDYSVASAISGRLVRLTHFRDRRTVPRLKPPTPDVEVTYPRAA